MPELAKPLGRKRPKSLYVDSVLKKAWLANFVLLLHSVSFCVKVHEAVERFNKLVEDIKLSQNPGPDDDPPHGGDDCHSEPTEK